MKHQFFSRFLSVILIVMLAIVALPVTPARAAIFTVTKTSDTNDGTCDADCSLREAIIAANGAAGADTITLPAGTYTLTRVGTDDNSNNGDLDITDGVGATDITLTGAGSGSTTINGAVGWADRIFDVRASATVSMSGVTISGGNINNANGAGILKNGNGSLTLTDVVLSGNAVTGNPARGGGLYSNDGTVTITNSTISSNSAAREGGGIYANNGILNITLGTLGSNTAGREGGAINTNAVTTISNTTITGNSVTSVNRDGGGLWANANTTVINSTFSGNTTTRNGGNVFRNGGTVSFRNTILNAGSPGNCSGAITNTGTNIDSGSTCFTATNGSLINTDPSLGTLTGSPAYFPLNTGSPAIDAGDNTACAAAPVSNASQNGLTRPLDGNGDSTLTCDIGSYEAPTALLATTTLITADTPDPSLVGETVAVTVTVSGGATPTGTVDITGADTNCSITLAGGTGSCNVTFTSVGPKTLTATYNPDAAHSASSDTEPHTVNQATSTVTVTCPAAPQPYTGAAQTPCTASYSTSDGLNGSLTPTYSNNTNVGTATANATYAGDANHAGNSNSGTFDISQATSSVTVTCPASVIYTGAAQTPCTASYSTSDGLSGSLTPTYSNNTNVGTATANATYAGDANHAGNSNSATFDISQATSSVTVTCPASVIYTGAAQTPCTASYSTSDGLNGSLTPTYSNNTNVGTATANATYAGDANHAGNSNSATFDISQATSSVTVTCPASVIYTGAAQTPCTASYSTSDGLNGSLTPTYSNNTNVGTATANATYAGDANHAGNSNSATFDISQATSSVTVTCPASVIYTGAAQTPCTASYSTSDGLSGSLTPTYSNNTNVGTATANATYAGDANHAGNSNSATFDISQATSTVTVTCPASVIYTGSAQTPCTASYSTSDGLSGSLTPTYSNNTNVGTATANATYAGDANHAGNSNSGTFDISQATSTVTVTCPASVIYTGAAQTPCTASYSTSDGLNGSLTPTYSNNTNVGTATANATYAGDANHAGNSNSGTFDISQATSSVTVTCPVAAQPYTGSAQTPCTAEATGAGMSPVDVSASLVYSNNINVGIATADASWDGDASHTGNNGSGGFTIGQATSTVTVTCPVSVPYTGSAQTPCTAEATGAGMSPVDVSASLVYSNNINVGIATADASWGGDASHTGSNGSGSFAIGLAAQTITVITSAPATASNGSTFDVAATATSGLPVTITTSGVCTGGDTDGTATITMTSGTGTCSVFYDQAGDGNYLQAPKVQEDVTATEGPSFTSADNTSIDMGFFGTFTVTAVGNPSTMAITLTGGTLPAGVTLTDNGDGTATLQGTPTAGTSGIYNLVFTADNGVLPNGTQNFTLTIRNGPIIGADGINSIPETSGGSVIENESILDTLGITHLLVEFSQDVYNPAGDTDPKDVTNPANYQLVRTPDGVFSTVSCEGGVISPDVSISVDSVTYSNGGGSGPYIATLAVNGGFPLNVVGFHRLYVCGTTSIVDANNTNLVLAGNGTTPATDFQRNFSIVIQGGGGGGGGGGGAGSGSQIGGNFLIPVTGFAPHQTTPLPAQPADKFYKPMGEMTLEIPSLAIKYPIVGAPITNKTWDLTWLQNSVAYLEGSAYPTLAGNTVLTAHVLDANHNPGPFSDIKGMQVGQKIYIHVNGQTYVYQVQESRKILPTSISKVFKHEEDSWITLVTCEDFNAKTGLYAARRMVRAVLISVIPAKK